MMEYGMKKNWMSTKYLVVFFLGVMIYTTCSGKFKTEVEEVISNIRIKPESGL